FPARRRPAPGDLRRLVSASLDAPEVAPRRTLAVGLIGELVPGHRREQFQELVGRVQLVLPERGADEEAGHDRLADVHRVEHTAEPRVNQPDPRRAADHRLVPPDQLGRCLRVPRANALDQNLERVWLRHGVPPLEQRSRRGLIVSGLTARREKKSRGVSDRLSAPDNPCEGACATENGTTHPGWSYTHDPSRSLTLVSQRLFNTGVTQMRTIRLRDKARPLSILAAVLTLSLTLSARPARVAGVRLCFWFFIPGEKPR